MSSKSEDWGKQSRSDQEEKKQTYTRAYRDSDFSIRDITRISGVTLLTHVPPDLIRHTAFRGNVPYKIKQYYQLDNLQKFRYWRSLQQRQAGKERWLFYPCPKDAVYDVISAQEPMPYGEFFPRVFGKDAIYLFQSPVQAARVALKFGVENEGLIISCRVLPGKSFIAKSPSPSASSPPRGYNAVLASHGTDLGFGPLLGDMIALYTTERILMRYAAHVTRE